MALYAPGLGYYSRDSRKFGLMPESGSDFVTAPELSPLFGRALARQVDQALQAADSGEVWEFGAGSGALAPVGHVSTGGRTPRHFAVDPSGRWLLAANQGSDSVAVFRLDPGSGRPEPVGRPITVSRPACVVFAPPAR